jgi:hypothetical protein
MGQVINVTAKNGRNSFTASAGDTLRIKFNTGPAKTRLVGSIDLYAGGPNFNLVGQIVDGTGAVQPSTPKAPVGPTATCKLDFDKFTPLTDYYFEVQVGGEASDSGFKCDYVQPMDR